MKLGEAMYKEQAQAQAPGAAGAAGAAGNGVDGDAGGNASGADETVVDADFEEVKDDDQPAH